jgi:hypothetical protein
VTVEGGGDEGVTGRGVALAQAASAQARRKWEIKSINKRLFIV